jgi:hypothetical protein
LLAAACYHCCVGGGGGHFVARLIVYFFKASHNCCHVSQVLLLFLPFLVMLLLNKVPRSTSTALNLLQGFINNHIKNFRCSIAFVTTFLTTMTATISGAQLHCHHLNF